MFKSKRNRLIAGLQAFVLAAAIIVTAAIPSKEVTAAPTEVATAALGIDVARYQGQINWDQVAASGVQFAMIRVGYRTQKTGEIAKEAKIKFKMNDDKSKINNLYQEIGKAIYRKHSNSEEISIDEELNSYCTQIDELSKDLEEAQTELLKIKNKRICENCYAEIELNVKYCPHCGAKMDGERKDENAEILWLCEYSRRYIQRM